ncbi:hypothetical protein JOM56_005750 [Amanita muscaria]
MQGRLKRAMSELLDLRNRCIYAFYIGFDETRQVHAGAVKAKTNDKNPLLRMNARHDGDSEVSPSSRDMHAPIFTLAALAVISVVVSIALIVAFHYLAVLRSRRSVAAEAMAQVAEQERQRAVDRFCSQVRLDISHWEQERQREARRREEEFLPPYSREPKLPSFSEIDDVPAVDETRGQMNGTMSESAQIDSETLPPPSY